MTVRNHYPRHYQNFYHQTQMFSHHFPSTFLNVCFIMCLLCCTKGLKPITDEEKRETTPTTVASTTIESNIFDHIIPLRMHETNNNGNHENISGFFSAKRNVKSNLESAKIKTIKQKINGDREIMIPLFDEIGFVTKKESFVGNSSNIIDSIQKRNHQPTQSSLGFHVDVKPNNYATHAEGNVSSFSISINQLTKASKSTHITTMASIPNYQKVNKVRLYPPLPAMIQMSRESVEEKNRVPKSSIAKFLLEPELGQSWYNKNGPTPTFHDTQINGTTYQARLGSVVFLDCQVTAVEKDLVSWLKLENSAGFSLPVLLTVGFRPPHASENRFMLDFLPPHNYRLRIDNVQWRDEGKYICQLAVHPPSLIWSKINIIRPLVHLLDSDMNPVADLHYDVGTTIEMVCRVKRPPMFHVSVQWEVQRLHSFGLFI